MAEFKIPTEQVTLPSKGLLYPKESPLSKGEIEMRYMTAAHEDILTNANQGVATNPVVIELSNLSGGIYLFSFWENLKQPLRKLMNNKSLNSR